LSVKEAFPSKYLLATKNDFAHKTAPPTQQERSGYVLSYRIS